MYDDYYLLGIVFNNGVPKCTSMQSYVRNEVILEWYMQQDYVFELVNGEWLLLTKEEFIHRYGKHIENTKEKLNILERDVETLNKEIETYNKIRQEILK